MTCRNDRASFEERAMPFILLRIARRVRNIDAVSLRYTEGLTNIRWVMVTMASSRKSQASLKCAFELSFSTAV
jgi:hypothetical protein